jgi:cytidylate kinase
MEMSYDALVNRVMTALRLRDRSAKRASQQPLVAAERFSKPFITIAREPGSGGKLVGQEIAKRLGFTFYDEALVEEIAKSTKLRKNVVDQVDEKGRTALQDLIQGLVNPDYVSDITYFTTLCKVILSLAYRGNVVILGRGANFITPFAQGLHVRITAPTQVRVQRAMDYEGHPYPIAKEIVQKFFPASSDRFFSVHRLRLLHTQSL